MSLIIQNETPKEVLEENKKTLLSYKFETTSLEKILINLFDFFDKNEKFNSKEFSKSLSKELVQSFDTCFLFPIPKFSDKEKYEEEVKKVTKELITLYVKERVKILSEEIRAKEKAQDKEKIEVLKNEFSKLLSILPKN